MAGDVNVANALRIASGMATLSGAKPLNSPRIPNLDILVSNSSDGNLPAPKVGEHDR